MGDLRKNIEVYLPRETLGGGVHGRWGLRWGIPEVYLEELDG